MIILGIDPGSRFCGYALLEVEKRKIIAAGSGTIKTKSTLDLSQRIHCIYTEIKAVIQEYKPTYASVEKIFFGKNIQSSFILGHVRGVILLALAESNIPVFEYSPREIKQSVVGNGNASKKQIAYMVQNILQLKNPPDSPDAADALASALCLFNKEKLIL